MEAVGGDVARYSPKAVLGDKPLVQIARDICEDELRKSKVSEQYHGFSALRGVCVGDLGTVIALYQEISKQTRADDLPMPPSRQHEVFQNFCTNQLFHLNTRDGKERNKELSLKKIALEFAEASHDEMIASYKNDRDRIRQITSMNVTLDEGNTEQTDKLLELVDAGVFALHPRKLTSRTKNLGSDPVLQFQLSFRKILGISKLIGLSDRDRFELNGQQLLDWLAGDGNSANLRAHTRKFGKAENKTTNLLEHENAGDHSLEQISPLQSELPLETPISTPTTTQSLPTSPSVTILDLDHAGAVDNLIVSLGFEERCVPSAKRLALSTRPKRIFAVEFDIPGHLDETREIAKEIGAEFHLLNSDDVLNGDFPSILNRSLIDVSGLTKPTIYKLVKAQFTETGGVLAAISEPLEHRPTERDLETAIGDSRKFLGEVGVDKLTDILSGDKLPYSISIVDELHSDPSRNRKLCAFASAKHGRLIHLVEDATYDEIDVFVQSGNSFRHLVGQKTANIATGGGEMGSIFEYELGDPSKLLNSIFQNHYASYHAQNSNFDIALTGGKLEAIVAGVAAACLPVNRVVYVKPNGFDAERFSTGIGDTKIFKIKSGNI